MLRKRNVNRNGLRPRPLRGNASYATLRWPYTYLHGAKGFHIRSFVNYNYEWLIDEASSALINSSCVFFTSQRSCVWKSMNSIASTMYLLVNAQAMPFYTMLQICSIFNINRIHAFVTFLQMSLPV